MVYQSIDRSYTFFPLGLGRHLFVVKDKWIHTNPTKRVMICHGLTGDNIGPQRMLEKLSFRLCATFQDLEIIRFDFEGSGFSSNAFEQTSLKSMLNNALTLAGIDELPIICWMGLSTGSLIALQASYLRQKQEPIITISNGLFTPSFLPTENPISIRDGQLFIKPLFFEEKSRLDIARMVEGTKSYLRVILGENDFKHMQAKPLLDTYLIKSYVIEKADHLFSDVEHRFKLFNLIEELFYVIIKTHALSDC